MLFGMLEGDLSTGWQVKVDEFFGVFWLLSLESVVGLSIPTRESAKGLRNTPVTEKACL